MVRITDISEIPEKHMRVPGGGGADIGKRLSLLN